MAVSLGGSKQQKAELNVTPPIDVLLVLPIIFMVILRQKSKGLKSLLPEDAANQVRAPHPMDDNAISISRDQKLRVNHEEVSVEKLGDKDIDFGDVAQGIDIARGTGANRVALITH